MAAYHLRETQLGHAAIREGGGTFFAHLLLAGGAPGLNGLWNYPIVLESRFVFVSCPPIWCSFLAYYGGP